MKRVLVISAATLTAIAACVIGAVLLTDLDLGRDESLALTLDSSDMKRIEEAMLSNSASAIRHSLAAEIRPPGTKAAFDRRLRCERGVTGPITSFEFSEPVRSRADGEEAFASARVTIGYQRAARRDYTAYLVYEDGAWRLWFTEPLGIESGPDIGNLGGERPSRCG